jgi:hypothetical protein
MEVFILILTRFESWLPLGTLTEVVAFLIFFIETVPTEAY